MYVKENMIGQIWAWPGADLAQNWNLNTSLCRMENSTVTLHGDNPGYKGNKLNNYLNVKIALGE